MSKENDKSDTQNRPVLRFRDELRRGNHILSELFALDGQQLRVARLLQETDGITDMPGTTDHTLTFHIGGAPNVRRYYDGKLSGEIKRLRTTSVQPAYRPAQWELGGEVEVLHIYMDETTLSAIANEGFGFAASDFEILDIMGADDEFIAALAPILMQEMVSDDPASALMLDSFDQVIATHLLLRYSNRAKDAKVVIANSPPMRDDELVAKVSAYLSERIAENPSLQDVAGHVGLSKFYVQRRFRAALGLSPHEFVMQVRIKKIRDLLKGPMALADIAHDCGFSSQQHMTNAFTRHMGVSPGRFRKQIRD